MSTNNLQTDVQLVKKFDNWVYDDYGIEQRMPWISGAKLTTSRNATGDRQWGTLIGKKNLDIFLGLKTLKMLSTSLSQDRVTIVFIYLRIVLVH